jgi:hypothetical protein
MHGTPLASHWSATGFVVSGVDVANTRSTSSLLMRSLATSPARLLSDWLSLTITCTEYFVPPTSIGLLL